MDFGATPDEVVGGTSEEDLFGQIYVLKGGQIMIERRWPETRKKREFIENFRLRRYKISWKRSTLDGLCP